jgi:uncharacterized protein (DUF58 family)
MVVAHVTDPRELELPDVGRVVLQDPETGEEVLVNTSDPQVRQQYQERMKAHQDYLTHLLRRSGVERIEIRTDEDYVPALKAYFRSRKRRKRG